MYSVRYRDPIVVPVEVYNEVGATVDTEEGRTWDVARVIRMALMSDKNSIKSYEQLEARENIRAKLIIAKQENSPGVFMEDAEFNIVKTAIIPGSWHAATVDYIWPLIKSIHDSKKVKDDKMYTYQGDVNVFSDPEPEPEEPILETDSELSTSQKNTQSED